MQNLKNKLKKQGGFTLVEMLIVVAIIAILIAISIPMVNSSLDKAKQATDDANLRAAKAVASILYLDGSATIGKDYVYDIEKGTFVEGDTYKDEHGASKGYNKVAKNGIAQDSQVLQITQYPGAGGAAENADINIEWKAAPAA